MNKTLTILLISLSVKTVPAWTQTPLEDFLRRAEQESLYIRAGRAEADVRLSETERNNSPDDPEIEYEYMPGIENTGGKQISYGISQTFSWPGEYIARAKYNKLEREQAEINFLAEREEYLLRIKLVCYELIYAQKRQEILDWQQTNAESVLELTQKRLDQGEATALDVNNARLNLATANSLRVEGISQLEIKRKQLEMLSGIETFDPKSFTYLEPPD
ncbi:MAG: TolC family protein, partial [Rikenellaceae bacterium]|nr:TolC family protein [Rikenellaceae bacterium]